MQSTKILLKSFILFLFFTQSFALAGIFNSKYYGNRRVQVSDDQQWRGLDRQTAEMNRRHQQTMNSLRNQQDIVRRLEREHDDLTAQVQDLRLKIQRSENEITRNNQTIQQLQGTLANLERRQTTINSQVTNAKSELRNLESQWQNLRQNAEPHRAELRDLRQQLKQILDACVAQGRTEAQCRAEANYVQLDARIKTKIELIQNLDTQIAQMGAQVKAKEEQVKTLERSLATVTQELQKNRQDIQNLGNENQRLLNIIAQTRPELQRKLNLLQNTNNQLISERRSLDILERRELDERERLRIFTAELRDLERYLERLITESNERGYLQGRQHGAREGQRMANRIGNERGQNDGQMDGEREGTRAGQTRDYNLGHAAGVEIGTARANEVGRADGVREGTIQGNKDAAIKEGQEAGRIRANNSDAGRVGQAQGQVAGLARATKDGESKGTPIGEEEGIRLFENKTLPSVTVPGDYTVSFSYEVPRFPGSDRGDYSPTDADRESRQVARSAFLEGYDFAYLESSEKEFYQYISGVYERFYRDSYSRNYTEYSNRQYPGHRNQGQADGDRTSYGRVYPQVYSQYFQEYRLKFASTPNRNSAEYKQTYQEVEARSYATVYEEIRANQFRQVEEQTYQTNLPLQVEIFRKARLAQVSKIYQEHPVLSYETSETIDGGIRGVAARDGVYQPQETVSYNLKIKNFGVKEASAVKVVLGDKTFILPNIPGQSIVDLVGVMQTSIPNHTQLPQTFESKHQVILPLTAEKKIQGRHYVDANSGILSAQQSHKLVVNYPLAISGIKLANTLLLNHENLVSAQIEHRSKRAYRGSIDIELSSSLGEQVITQKFASLSELAGNLPINGAKILVSNQDDVFNHLNLKINISMSGVLIGQTTVALSEVVRVKYDKNKTQVLLGDSKNALVEMRRSLRDLGGVDQLAVLDLSLSENQSLFDLGLKQKISLVANNENSLLNITNGVLNSQQSVFLFLEGSHRDLSTISGLLVPKNSALQMDIKMTGFGKLRVLSTNEYGSDLVKGRSNLYLVHDEHLGYLLELAKLQILSNEDLLTLVQKEVTSELFFAPNSKTKILFEEISLRIFQDLFKLNNTYQASATGRTNRRDVKWVKMLESDPRVLTNLFEKRMKETDQLVLNLFSYGLHYIIDEGILAEMNEVVDMADKIKLAKKGRADDIVKVADGVFKKHPQGKVLKKAAQDAKKLYYPFSE